MITRCGPPFRVGDALLLIAAASQLRDDYGTTKGAADMFEYTLRVTFEGVTKTARADDGTMPAEMRQIVAILGGTIDSARAHAKP